MNIGVIGLGKLGCSMFSAFAASGNNVFGYDINLETREKLKCKIEPVSETDLQDEIIKGFENYTIVEKPSEVIRQSDVIYIIVPTPSKKDGTFDTSYLERVISSIYDVDCNCNNKLLVVTSTVLPGDTRKRLISDIKNQKSKISKINFCYSPEFIALGSVLNDLKNPDFLLVGEEFPNSGENHIKAMMTIIKNKNIPIRRMSIESAEMAKIAINSYITFKISFANAIGLTSDNIDNCSSIDVLSAVGSDSRIGKNYLSKGLGFGGPCFPRDNRAIQQVINKTEGLDFKLPLENEIFNKKLPEYFSKEISKFCKKKDLQNILVIGLSYKDNSYLIEESQSYSIALKLTESFDVFYYDTNVKKDDVNKKIKKFSLNTNVSGDFLLLNCSREMTMMRTLKKILEQKNLNFIEYEIWE